MLSDTHKSDTHKWVFAKELVIQPRLEDNGFK